MIKVLDFRKITTIFDPSNQPEGAKKEKMKAISTNKLTNAQKLAIGFFKGYVIVDSHNNPVIDNKGAYVFKTKSIAQEFCATKFH